MVSAVLPAIPRVLTALCEWYGCVMFLLPMKKRFSPAVTALLLALALPVQMGLQYAASLLNTSALGFYLGMSANVGFMFLTMLCCCEMERNGCLVWTMFAFSTAEFLASLHWQIVGGLWQQTLLFSAGSLLLALVLFGASTISSEVMIRASDPSSKRYPGIVTLTVVAITLLQFVGSNVIPNIMPWQETRWLRFSFGLTRTLVDAVGITILFLFAKIQEEHAQRREMDALAQIMHMQYQQHLDFMETSAYISRQCHDLKHQVAAFRSACTSEEQESYLRELEAMIARYNFYCNTGNKVLDSILTQKAIYCGQHDIRLSYETDGSALEGLPVRALCVLFGNLLDNAIEAVSEVRESENRQIFLEVFEKADFRMIQVENYCEKMPALENGLPKTTKPDKSMHGYGLKSVQYTVQQHGGTLRCTWEDGWFIAKILIPRS